jgi:hypothetical protein
MDTNRPYYYIAWDQNDNPECNYTTESRDPCWWRLWVTEINTPRPKQLSGPLLKNEAKARLEQLKLLIGEDGQYDY